MCALLRVFDLCIVVLGNSITYDLNINTNSIVTEIAYPYYGFTFDFWRSDDPNYGKKWGNAGILEIDLSNTNLIALTKALTPATLRIGGSPQDMVIFNISGECNQQYGYPGYQCPTMNRYKLYNLLWMY